MEFYYGRFIQPNIVHQCQSQLYTLQLAMCTFTHLFFLQGKKKVLATALGFGPGWRQLGLPHPIPIACVGCGSCDTELLQAIAQVTRGMFVVVGHVSELSTFFRRQAS